MSSLPSTIRHDFAAGVEGWVIHDPVAQRVHWLGREALMLGSARPILAPVAPEPPYTIRATLSGGPGESYVGFCFHLADVENYETIYLAPGSGGQPTAIQYDPVMNGSTTWQIFGDADGIGTRRPGQALDLGDGRLSSHEQRHVRDGCCREAEPEERRSAEPCGSAFSCLMPAIQVAQPAKPAAAAAPAAPKRPPAKPKGEGIQWGAH